ncbi:MAG: glycogen synthase GlgA [Acidobacteriota bacterium]
MPRILMVSSEAVPFAKSGGLGDVLGALPQALRARGEEVAVILPRYRSIPLEDAARVATSVSLHPGWMVFKADLWVKQLKGVPYYFVDCPPLYDRDGLYGSYGVDFGDNHIRFSLLSHAAIALARQVFQPQIINIHDWQAALVAPYFRHYYAHDPTFFGVKLVATIHNLGYQGRFGANLLPDIGLAPEHMRPDLMEFYGDINLLKGAIVYSDWITTVSPTYAREIQTPQFGEGLEGLLSARSNSLSGILNGVDYAEWNPETDRYLAQRYSADTLEGKRACKLDILREYGLPTTDPKRPLIGIVSRFAKQKGFDLIAQVAEPLVATGAQFVVLGTGEREYEDLFRGLAAAHPEQFAVRVEYSNALAHKIEAGADFFLMPSRYEPCGLNQIYSLRYGTLPIVRATGGLEDTVDGETGFKFWGYTGAEMLGAIHAALDVYTKRPALYRQMQRAAMGRDFSWDSSAAQYSELFASLLA